MKTNHIDGWLYVGLGICAATMAILDTTDAGKFILPVALFYVKAYTSILNSALLAAKMYRSTNFAKAQDAAEAAAKPDAEAPGTPVPVALPASLPASTAKTISLLCLLGAIAFMGGGCAVVSANRVFPKLTWYWSADAREQRQETAPEKKYEHPAKTNETSKPNQTIRR